MRLLIFLFMAGAVVSGQRLSVGVAGGGSLTDGFPETNVPVSFGPGSSTIGLRYFSSSKDWIIGPAFEFHFNSRWSVEADGLYRKVHFVQAAVLKDGTLNSVSPSPVVTWEFPVLAKYRFQAGRTRPFVEAGPSFRTAGNLNGTDPSHTGMTVGAGVEFRSRDFRFAPQLRYTRWAADGRLTGSASSGVNQVELLVTVSHSSELLSHPMGNRLSAGFVLGTGITHVLPPTDATYMVGSSTFRQITTPARSLIAGAMVEFKVSNRFSVETDALYRPLRAHVVDILDGRRRESDSGSISVWELPQLAKYRLMNGPVRPFAEGGESFRTPGGGLGSHGVTAGVGLESRWRAFRMSPTLRYTRWAKNPFEGATRPDQVEALVGVSF